MSKLPTLLHVDRATEGPVPQGIFVIRATRFKGLPQERAALQDGEWIDEAYWREIRRIDDDYILRAGEDGGNLREWPPGGWWDSRTRAFSPYDV
jgi:hypothetical protein